MDSGKTLQRLMMAVGLLVAGGAMLVLSTVAKSSQKALMGEPEAPAEVRAAPEAEAPAHPGAIHVQPGDPLPPATPLPRPGAEAGGEGKSPAEMSRAELMDEVAALRAKVARLEAQQAKVREALGPQGDGVGHR